MGRKSALFYSACLIAVTAALPVFAQDAAPAETDEVVVTGTRLNTRALNSPQPVTTVGSEQIELQGYTQVSDIVEQLPALRSSTSSIQALGSAATLNLRGLGSNRTLTLVNGRRHVAGVAGSSAVDVNTIPSALIDRIEVLTGGASAVYGSDAVTGVVNFVMKRDFEGTEITAQGGLSGQGDGAEAFVSLAHGRNFDGGKGNVSVALQANRREAIAYGDRSWSRDGAVANDYTNPARLFQRGDPIPPGRTENNTLGNTILLSNGNPRYTGTAQSLIDRAAAAPAEAFISKPRFAISSTSTLIGFDPFGTGFADSSAFGSFLTVPDVDNNGVDDCLESRIARSGFGCWVSDPVTGQIRPYRDGIYAGGQNHSGGDGAAETFDGQSITADETVYTANLFFNYEVNRFFKPYLEAKVTKVETSRQNPYNTYDDSVPISLENPFIPAAIREFVDAELAADPSIASTAQVMLTRDHIDIFDPNIEEDRITYRAVVGFEGEFANGWTYDVSYNYGRSEADQRSSARLEDRFYAALDVVVGPNGQPVCRSTLDPTALPPVGKFTALSDTGIRGFETFTAGANSPCRPLNAFGLNTASAEALAFQRYIAESHSELSQQVFSAVLVGDTEDYFSLQGGPIAFATGVEYRKEDSSFVPDEVFQKGQSFQYTVTGPTSGEFDVKEAFLEIEAPILADLPIFETLTLNAAIRVADYSTVQNTTTWNVRGVWAPISDVRFRMGKALTIRAPNIAELFSPQNSATFRPDDPCDIGFRNLGAFPENREKNCLADGLPADFTDPLTARFVGVSGGNPDLKEEESESFTYGVVLTPRFLPGFSATLDYWTIRIEGAISTVSAQNIVDSCYDAASLDNEFCRAFTRDRNPNSPTFGGFTFLRQVQLNFAAAEAAGWDFDIRYRFDLADLVKHDLGRVRLGLSGTKLLTRDDYPFPGDPNRANPALLELNFPEYALNGSASWTFGDFTTSWFTSYQGRQANTGVQIETAEQITPAFAERTFVHDASIRWDVRDDLDLVFGVNNVTDVEPFVGLTATPVSPVGRYFFLRANAKF